jgi:hypothetical protein
MNYDEIISKLKVAANNLIQFCDKEFGGTLQYEIDCSEYDKAHSSYMLRFNAFGFPIDIIIDMETNECVAYDFNNDRTIGTVSLLEKFDFADICTAVFHYSEYLHCVDSTSCFSSFN